MRAGEFRRALETARAFLLGARLRILTHPNVGMLKYPFAPHPCHVKGRFSYRAWVSAHPNELRYAQEMWWVLLLYDRLSILNWECADAFLDVITQYSEYTPGDVQNSARRQKITCSVGPMFAHTPQAGFAKRKRAL